MRELKTIQQELENLENLVHNVRMDVDYEFLNTADIHSGLDTLERNIKRLQEEYK